LKNKIQKLLNENKVKKALIELAKLIRKARS